MGTKLFTPIFIVAIAIMAGINVFNAQKPTVLSDVAKENVEALADDEVTGPCKGLGYVYCSYNGYWVEYQLKK